MVGEFWFVGGDAGMGAKPGERGVRASSSAASPGYFPVGPAMRKFLRLKRADLPASEELDI